MEIKYGRQIDISELKNKPISLFLLAGNHEKRVLSAYIKVEQQNKIHQAIMFCYKKEYCLEPSNDKITNVVIEDVNHIYDLLNKHFEKFKNKNINIVVDYSCMTKPWYYAIILYLSKKNLSLKAITSYFIYTPSKYSAPQEPKPNSEIAPLPGKYVVPTDKPKALIVCLGYEQNKAEGIIEHLDPKRYYIFYTKPALDDCFVETLEENNKDILDRSKNIFTFPFDNLLNLERQLTSIYLQLKNDFSIIIAPLGPKPFTFIAMLMSVKYDDIDIWRVGSGSDINEYDREPIDENLFILSEVFFENVSIES